MGGGDLNLKKSWHPSTMKNMEKVRKAEQQNNQENKRIAELKRQIEMEKDREDMTKYAMEQGVIEKKDEKKLDWMYKGPNQMVNREEYLLGRPVDKAFEQMKQAEKEAELIKVPKNHVEYECIPPSLRFFSGNEQVDLVRKMQEDPLYAIKKKEMENRSQLLKNPVKLKQLKQLLEQQSHKSKSKKKSKKEKKSEQKDSSEDEAELDKLLAIKYKQLKNDISEKDLLKSMKKIKYKKKKSRKRSHDSESESDSSSDDAFVKKRQHKQRKKQRSTSDSDSDIIESLSSENVTQCEKKDKKEYDKRKCLKDDIKIDNDNKRIRRGTSSKHRDSKYVKSRKHEKEYNTNCKQRYKQSGTKRDSLKDKYKNERKYSAKKRNDTTISNNERPKSISYRMKLKEDKKETKYRSKLSLTEEEKEQRRQEMIVNAAWRDKEREKNVKMYREEEKREMQNNSYNKDFIRYTIRHVSRSYVYIHLCEIDIIYDIKNKFVDIIRY